MAFILHFLYNEHTLLAELKWTELKRNVGHPRSRWAEGLRADRSVGSHPALTHSHLLQVNTETGAATGNAYDTPSRVVSLPEFKDRKQGLRGGGVEGVKNREALN